MTDDQYNKLLEQPPYVPNIEKKDLINAIKKYEKGQKVELCKNDDGSYFIRKGVFKHNCVVDSLDKKDLMILMKKIDKLLCKD